MIFWIPLNSYGQNHLQTILNYADDLKSRGEIKEAIHEYKRWIYYSQDYKKRVEIEWNVANLLLNIREYEEANNYFNIIRNVAENPVIKENANVQYIYTLVLLTKYEEALFEIELMESRQPCDSLIGKVKFMKIWSLNLLNKYNEAQEEIEKYFINDEYKIQKMDSLYRVCDEMKNKNPNKAFILSVILPGSGQWYVNRKVDALISSMLVGTLGFATIVSTIYGHYFLALFSGLQFTQKFYSGGARYAKALAEEYNQQQEYTKALILNQMLMKLMK